MAAKKTFKPAEAFKPQRRVVGFQVIAVVEDTLQGINGGPQPVRQEIPVQFAESAKPILEQLLPLIEKEVGATILVGEQAAKNV